MTATFDQVFSLICQFARRLWSDPSLASRHPPLFIWGAPGVGKSAAPRQAAAHLAAAFIDIRLSQYEPADLRGLPFPDEKAGLTTWLPSSELPWEPASRGILMLDELNSADRSVQAAAYQLVLERSVGQRRLPDGWLIVAAGNRCEDHAISYPISSALANRFCHVELEPDVEQWCAWAESQGLSPEVVAFLRFCPERFFSMEGDLQRGWPSPRSWERVAHALGHQEGQDRTTLELQIEGLVGQAAAVEFAAFRDCIRLLPDPVSLLRGELKWQLPSRADQRHALCAGLAWHLWRATGSELQVRLDNFLAISLQLPADFATMMFHDALRSAPRDASGSHAKRLFAHPSYSTFAEKLQVDLAEALT